MKKINLNKVSNTLSDNEMKQAKGGIVNDSQVGDPFDFPGGGGGGGSVMMGNREGTIIGCRHPKGKCYIDVRWDDGKVECEIKMPEEFCNGIC